MRINGGFNEGLMMIALLGSSGYVGSFFQALLDKEGLMWIPINRESLINIANFKSTLVKHRVTKIINCAGFTGKPNVDACELAKPQCFYANVVLPGMIRTVCEELDIPWGHVSSGCIYTGYDNFTEEDSPNFTFAHRNCSYYSGTKALGENMLLGASKCYIWRLRIPFDNTYNSRNYLQKLINYDKLINVRNSLSQLDEFVAACLDCFRLNVSYGTYNLTNPGTITTKEVVNLMKEYGNNEIKARIFKFFDNIEEFNKVISTPRSNCTLNSNKALDAGLKLTNIESAIIYCLTNRAL